MIDPMQAISAVILAVGLVGFASILIFLAVDEDSPRARSRR